MRSPALSRDPRTAPRHIYTARVSGFPALLGTVTDSVPALIGYVDRDERYRFVNQAYVEWFGRPREAIVGRTVGEVLGPARYASVGPWVRRALAGERVTFEQPIDHRDGSHRVVRVVYAPDRDDGGAVRGYVGCITDITDLELANRSKDDFLAVLSHELRTPLNAVLGWVRMLREGGMEVTEQERAFEVIERNARAQIQLIEDLLDISRIASGKLHFDVRAVRMEPLIAGVVDALQPTAAAKKIELHTDIAPGGPVMADPERLAQVLWNLVGNALKFTRPGGRVDIRLTRDAQHVTVAVSDTGEGISKDVLPFVFDRFRQGESGTTRRFGGLGLGLTLVKHLVEAHGGTVSAESAGRGTGSTFTVRLPVERA